MLVTPLGIIVFWQPAINVFVAVLIMALQLFRLSYTAFPSSTDIDVRPEQLEKASLPMLVTLLGMVTEVKLLQPAKASSPMLVTPSSMMTVLMEVL